MSQPISLPSFGGDAPVGAIATQYPLQPGVDVLNVLGASTGVAATAIVKLGTFSVAGTATGTVSDAITYAEAFPTSTDGVLCTLTSLGGAVINGSPVVSASSATGVTIAVDITTAGTADITGTYVAIGH